MKIKWDWIKYQWQLLPHRPKLWWDSLWVRKNEFHSSLSMNMSALLHMNEKDSLKYRLGLIYRRELAHQRDLDRNWWQG